MLNLCMEGYLTSTESLEKLLETKPHQGPYGFQIVVGTTSIIVGGLLGWADYELLKTL